MNDNPFGFCAEPKCHDDDPPKELPSFADMARGLLSTMKDVAAGAIQGEGLFVSEDVYTTRMNICRTCEFFVRDTSRCTQCGCFMEAKTRLVKAHCPIHKWGTDE
jgi:hypothetical protein